MGVYEFNVLYFGDLAGGCDVAFGDFAVLALSWQQDNPAIDIAPPANPDGVIDSKELKILADHWLECYVGQAQSPSPVNASMYNNPNGTVLSWSPSVGAVSYDVYFGIDANLVAGANQLSGAFVGTVNDTNFDPCGLSFESEYFWRVDTVGPKCTKKGDTWSFETGSDIPLAGMVSYWSFDEAGGGTAYDLAGGNNGTLYGDANWTSGQIGGALDFDGGDDYVQVSDDASLDFADEFTLSAWVKPAIVDVHGRIIYRYDSQSAYFLTLVPTAAGRWAFYVRVGGVTINIQSDVTPAGNVWSHLLATRNSLGELKLYVNGLLQSDIKTHAGAIDSSGDLFFGVDYVLNADFTGDIDEVRIYDRALSDAEVLQLYQAGTNQ
jgi:hypothetical protein